MTLKERIFDSLKGMGLMPKYDEDMDIVFKFMMATLFINFNDDDEDYLQILLPNIYEFEPDDRANVLEACNAVTRLMKVAKCTVSPYGSVWVSAEQLIDKNTDPGGILPRTLHILLGTRLEFMKAIENQNEDPEE